MTISEGNMFGRRLRLQVGDVVFDAPIIGPMRTGEGRGLLGDHDALRVSFKVRKKIPKKNAPTAGGEPPALELSVYNLSERTRRGLDELIGTKKRGIAFDAGYGDDVGTLFRGDLTSVLSTIEETEWVTRIVGKSGHLAGQTTMNDTVPPGSTKYDRVKKVIDILQRENPGVNFTRSIDRLKAKDYDGFATEIVNGVTLTGNAMDRFRVLTKDLGLESWVDDDEAVTLFPNEVRGDRRVVLSPMTGLIGPPARIFDEKFPGKLIIRVRSLLQWRLGLGGVVELVSAGLSGFFRVRALAHTGDTHGEEYSTEVEAEEVSAAYDPITKTAIQGEAQRQEDIAAGRNAV